MSYYKEYFARLCREKGEGSHLYREARCVRESNASGAFSCVSCTKLKGMNKLRGRIKAGERRFYNMEKLTITGAK